MKTLLLIVAAVTGGALTANFVAEQTEKVGAIEQLSPPTKNALHTGYVAASSVMYFAILRSIFKA